MAAAIKCPGGTVVRDTPRKWRVNAPDGRYVGTFSTRRAALQKAEHWDKWDAFDSLADICATISPMTFILFTKTILSVGEKELFIPTEEQMTVALLADYILFIARDHPEVIDKLRENPNILEKLVEKVKDVKRSNP